MRGLGGGLPPSPQAPAAPVEAAKPRPAMPAAPLPAVPQTPPGTMPMLRQQMMNAVLPTLNAPNFGVPMPGGINEQPGRQQIPNLNLPIGWRV